MRNDKVNGRHRERNVTIASVELEKAIEEDLLITVDPVDAMLILAEFRKCDNKKDSEDEKDQEDKDAKGDAAK